MTTQETIYHLYNEITDTVKTRGSNSLSPLPSGDYCIKLNIGKLKKDAVFNEFAAFQFLSGVAFALGIESQS